MGFHGFPTSIFRDFPSLQISTGARLVPGWSPVAGHVLQVANSNGLLSDEDCCPKPVVGGLSCRTVHSGTTFRRVEKRLAVEDGLM